MKEITVLQTADVIITDYYLPDINGIELIHRVRKLRPDLPALLLTGARDSVMQSKMQVIPRSLLLHKPLGIDELEEGIQEVISKNRTGG